MFLVKSILQGVAIGAIPKSVGSAFRIWDDRNAPDEIMETTVKREGLILGLTTMFTALAKPLLNQKLPQIGLNLAKNGTHANILAAIVGISTAEALGRIIEPKPGWTENGERSIEEDKDEPSMPRKGLNVLSPSSFGATFGALGKVAPRSIPAIFPSPVVQPHAIFRTF